MNSSEDIKQTASPNNDKGYRSAESPFINTFRESLNRFPFTFTYIGGFIIWGIVYSFIGYDLEHIYNPTANIPPALWIWLSNGIGVSLAIDIWCEQLGPTKYRSLMQGSAIVILLIIGWYLIFNYKSIWLTTPTDFIVTETAILFAIFFVPSRKNRAKDNSLIFCLVQLRNLIIGTAIAIGLATVIYLGLFISSFLCSDLKLGDGFIFNLLIIVPATAGMLIFVLNMPTQNNIRNWQLYYKAHNDFFKLLCYLLLTIFIPSLLAIYCYGFICLTNSSTTEIQVSFWIILFTGFSLFYIFILKTYSIFSNDRNPLLRIIHKYVPLTLIPAISLMGIAVINQISRYGISIARLYALTFVIWTLFIMVYLFITKLKRLMIVPLSFIIISLLTTITPGFNYANIVKNHMQNRIIYILESAGINRSELPLTSTQQHEIILKFDPETRNLLISDEQYLRQHYDRNVVEEIVVDF